MTIHLRNLSFSDPLLLPKDLSHSEAMKAKKAKGKSDLQDASGLEIPKAAHHTIEKRKAAHGCKCLFFSACHFASSLMILAFQISWSSGSHTARPLKETRSLSV